MIFRIDAPRIFMRPLTLNDSRSLQRIAGKPDIARMLFSVKSPWLDIDVREWIENSYWNEQLGFRLGICLSEEDRPLIGVVGIGRNPVNCSFFLDQKYWGNGYATEAMRALLGYCFENFGLREITADHFDDNPASGKVLRKLGFEKIGTGLEKSAARSEPAPNVLYRLTQKQFQK